MCQLTRHLYASGLKGPMPEEVALLENLTDLRISDTTGINAVPILSSKDIIKTLVYGKHGLGPESKRALAYESACPLKSLLTKVKKQEVKDDEEIVTMSESTP
ncbi:hypothetical protein YC2023_083185 [Brassica napus]